MSGYLSNLLTSTTDRYNSLRRNLLASEGDGDTEDDSHICRVLRAYYTEKSRQLPEWLPPDPKKAVAAATAQQQGVGSSYSSLWNSGSAAPTVVSHQTSASSRSALSDLWDTPAQGPAQRTTPLSLRSAGRQQQQQQPVAAATAVPRPLPSQRAGSYQSLSARSRTDPQPAPQGYGSGTSNAAQQEQRYSGGASGGGGGGAGGATAQERLKARLWGQSGSGAGAGGGAGNRWG